MEAFWVIFVAFSPVHGELIDNFWRSLRQLLEYFSPVFGELFGQLIANFWVGFGELLVFFWRTFGQFLGNLISFMATFAFG